MDKRVDGTYTKDGAELWDQVIERRDAGFRNWCFLGQETLRNCGRRHEIFDQPLHVRGRYVEIVQEGLNSFIHEISTLQIPAESAEETYNECKPTLPLRLLPAHGTSCPIHVIHFPLDGACIVSLDNVP